MSTRIPLGEEPPPNAPIEMFFYTENKHATSLLADELNRWVYYSMDARTNGEYCVIAIAERCILDEEDKLETIAKRFGAVFDGHGTSMRGG